MEKVKNVYLVSSGKDSYEVIFELENGTVVKQRNVATGNCWTLYWSKVNEPKELLKP